MPPKVRFTKDKVVSSTIDFIAQKSVHQLSARNIAKEINSSTAPLYSYFKSMDELRDTALVLAFESVLAHINANLHSNRVVGMGLGLIEYARKFPNLYKAIFIESYNNILYSSEITNLIYSVFEKEKNIKSLKKDELKKLTELIWIIINGTAINICSIKDLDIESTNDNLAEYIELAINYATGNLGKPKSKVAETISLF